MGGTAGSAALRLSWTAGEPVAGTVSRDGIVVRAGLQATLLPPPTDQVFRDGFEPDAT